LHPTSALEGISLPIYEYACVDCGNHIEVKQSFSDEPLKVCQECGGRLRRVFHSVGVFFKGSGFYSTDHRQGTKAKEKSQSEEAAKAGNGDSKKQGKAESGSKDQAKPAAKTTEKSD
jgi:putative FmdB family regulatory protein